MTLPLRLLGRTGLRVTSLGFGAMELRHTSHRNPRPLEEGQAERVLNAVLDRGINFIDTSIDYGESEESIGRYISHRREEYYLASKCGCPPNASEMVDAPPGPLPHTFTRENIIAGVDQSLRRLRTDHLDLLQLHQTPRRSELERDGAIETLIDLRHLGKTRFIGTSSSLPNITEHIEMNVFDAFQIPYSALQLQHHDVISDAARTGAGVIVRGGVAQGAPGKGRGSVGPAWTLWDAAGLDDLSDGMTRTDFLLRFALSHSDVSTVIVGTLDSEHIDRNAKAASAGPLPSDTYDEARRRLLVAVGRSDG